MEPDLNTVHGRIAGLFRAKHVVCGGSLSSVQGRELECLARHSDIGLFDLHRRSRIVPTAAVAACNLGVTIDTADTLPGAEPNSVEKQGTESCRLYVACEFRCDVSGFSGVHAESAGGVCGTEAALFPRRLVGVVWISKLWVCETGRETGALNLFDISRIFRIGTRVLSIGVTSPLHSVD